MVFMHWRVNRGVLVTPRTTPIIPGMDATTADPVRRPWRPWQLALAALLLAGAVAGGWTLYWVFVQHRLGTISEGRVYRSGRMPPAEMAATAQRLGLKTVIDLRTSREGQDETNTTDQREIESEAAALAAVGVRHIHLPSSQVPDQATLDRFLAEIRDPSIYPTLIHCYHGVGRAELFSAVYRIEQEGWDPDAARCATRFIVAGSSFDVDKQKGVFLKDYRPHPQPVAK